ncbi:MAG TPA: Ig-like domain-containing protein [Gemmatimonadales bacterium]|nr:Ig-like domain-containing protein [Gemmatimonadales bacterium]
MLDDGVAVGLSVTFTATAQPGVQRRLTETRIGTDPDPSDEGEAVTIFVRVRASSGGDRPRGSVVLYDRSSSCGDGALLGQIELDDDGEGSLTTRNLAVGFHTIRGCYSGSASFAPSDDIANQTVRED